MSRLALSDADKEARDWFVETTKSLGCKIQIDAMGNTFAVRPGKRGGPPTCAGSHLDTQPSGGRYVCRNKVDVLSTIKADEILGWNPRSLCWSRDAKGTTGGQN